MPKINKNNTVIDGEIIGFVRIEGMYEPSSFAICSVEDWEKMTALEAEKTAIEAKNESGLIEFWY